MGGANSEIQYALVICEHCPALEELDSNSLVYNFHFGREIQVEPGHFSSLRIFHVGYITWDTFIQIWGLAVNLGMLISCFFFIMSIRTIVLPTYYCIIALPRPQRVPNIKTMMNIPCSEEIRNLGHCQSYDQTYALRPLVRCISILHSPPDTSIFILFTDTLKFTGIVESPTMASLSVISLDALKINTILSKNRFILCNF